MQLKIHMTRARMRIKILDYSHEMRTKLFHLCIIFTSLLLHFYRIFASTIQSCAKSRVAITSRDCRDWTPLLVIREEALEYHALLKLSPKLIVLCFPSLTEQLDLPNQKNCKAF